MSEATVRYLSDWKNGGPPRAFECLLDTAEYGLNGKFREDVCGCVTRTLRGMRQHQHLVHDFKPQQKLFKVSK